MNEIDDKNKAGKIPVRKGDKWLVLVLGVVAIVTFAMLGIRFSDVQEWGNNSTMQLMVKLLETIGIIFVLGILIALFRLQKFEQSLLRNFFKLFLILLAIILTLIFAH